MAGGRHRAGRAAEGRNQPVINDRRIHSVDRIECVERGADVAQRAGQIERIVEHSRVDHRPGRLVPTACGTVRRPATTAWRPPARSGTRRHVTFPIARGRAAPAARRPARGPHRDSSRIRSANDLQAGEQPGEPSHHVIGEQRRVGKDDPFDARVGDVSLVPERDVLQARLQIAPQHPRQARRSSRPRSDCACGASPTSPSGPA